MKANTTTDRINAIYVEDNPSDIELFKSIIEAENSSISCEYIESLEEIKDRFSKESDVIISDYNLRGFDGLKVLELAKELCPDTPFIFFSSTIGEEKAVELMKKGATDFVLKDNIIKIPVAIERAFKEKKLLNQQKKYKQELVKKDDLLDTLFNSLTDLVMIRDKEGRITKVNHAFCQFFKTTYQNVEGKNEKDYILDTESEVADEQVLSRKESYNYEIELINEAGDRKILEIIKSPLTSGTEIEGIASMMRDVTTKKLLQEEKAKDRHILQQAESQTLSGSYEFDQENDILSVSPHFIKLLNLKSDLSFISFNKLLSLIHPDDQPMFKNKFEHSVNEAIDFELEHRYIPVGYKEGFRYCKTVLKPYLRQQNTVFYGTIQDTTENRETSLALLNVQEEERERISKELHDNVGQKLSASSMFLDAEKKDLTKIKNLVDEAITDIRGLSRVLTTSILDNNTFSEALEFLIENTPNADKIEVIDNFEDERIPEFIGGQLYRIIQEALNNTMKYSKAEKVLLSISEGEHSLAVTISDNGKGYDMDSVKLGNGIRNMRERVRNCNGEFSIHSKPDQGTTINIKIPMSNEKDFVS